MDCLNTLIGLSRTACACYPEIPVNESTSGVYVDEARGFNLDVVANQNDCKNGGLWDIMLRAKESAQRQLVMDLNKCINTDTSNRYSACKGLFTSNKIEGTALANDYIALKLVPEGLDSTSINITSIGLMATSVGNVDWYIYSNQDMTTALHSGSFAVVASGVNANVVNITLDLSAENCLDLKYYLIYKLNGVTTKSNKIYCKPCGGGKAACYEQFYAQNGISGNDINLIDTWTSSGNYANGMLYSGAVVCDVNVCDYLISEASPLYDWIVTAYQMKAAEIAYYNAINGGDFSRYTTLDLDSLQSQLIDYKSWYDEAMQYVCQEIVKMGHPCLVCDTGLKRFTIYS